MNSNDSTWIRRSVVDEPRLSELVEMYESLGFEVHVENVIPEELSTECRVCLVGRPDSYKVIYTRKKRNDDPNHIQGG